jgi:hypothetical protein
MDAKDKSIKMVKPHLEELAKTYNGHVREKSPIGFGETYNASTDEYDLILQVEDDFELGIRFSGDESKTYLNAYAYFAFSEDGKRHKTCKHIDSVILNEDNVKKTIQKFLKVYEDEKDKNKLK